MEKTLQSAQWQQVLAIIEFSSLILHWSGLPRSVTVPRLTILYCRTPIFPIWFHWSHTWIHGNTITLLATQAAPLVPQGLRLSSSCSWKGSTLQAWSTKDGSRKGRLLCTRIEISQDSEEGNTSGSCYSLTGGSCTWKLEEVSAFWNLQTAINPKPVYKFISLVMNVFCLLWPAQAAQSFQASMSSFCTMPDPALSVSCLLVNRHTNFLKEVLLLSTKW